MNIQYRLAQSDDAQDLLTIKQQVWPQEASNLQQIQMVLNLSDHLCYVAEVNNHVIGFMDCFPTSNQGVLRMDMDLLAVLPAYRGKRIASTLIQRCLQHEELDNTAIIRTLIQVDNIASQKSFQHNGFILQPEIITLYVTSAENGPLPIRYNGFSGHLLPVQTLNYSGFWIEAPFSSTDLVIPQHFQTLGTLLPENNEYHEQVSQLGFEKMNQYQWWILPTKEN
ncbi:MAG: GNAT family N-acetyltransferase [Anaerolineaceae bacterium]|nr:GNAT family N-acetyltransferase [Anaerolineaceae bacterium]